MLRDRERVWRAVAASGLGAAGVVTLVWFGGTPDRALYLAFLLLAAAALAVCAGRARARLTATEAGLAAIGIGLCLMVALRPTLTARGFTLYAVWWLALFVTMALTERREDTARRLVLALAVAAAGESLFGLIQAVGGIDRIGTYERGIGSLASGTFINRNHFAAFVNLGLMVTVGSAHLALIERPERPAARSEARGRAWLVILGCGLLGWAVILSRSRGGVFALTAALVLMALLLLARRRAGGASALVVALVLASIFFAGFAVGLDPLVDRLKVASPADRIGLFEDTLGLIADHPLGVGPGMYEMRFRPYQTGGLDRRYHHAHNDYLEILAEWGLVLGLGLIGLALWALHRAICGFLRAERPAHAALLLGISGALASALAHGLIEHGLQTPAIAIGFWALAGIAWTSTATATGTRGAGGGLPAAPARALLALALVAASWQVFPRWRALQIEKTRRGIESHLEALEWDPRNAEIHADLARRYRDAEPPDLAAAVASWERAVALNPWSWRYQMERSRALELAGRAIEAERAMLRAVELNPRAPRYRWRLAELYLRRGQLDRALPYLAEVVAVDPTRRDRVLAALMAAGAGADEIARAWPPDGASRLDLMRRVLAAWEPDPPRRLRALVAAEWEKLVAGPEPLAIADGLFLIEHLLKSGRPIRARRRWVQLLRATGSQDRAYARGESLVWNGDFEREPIASAFDWSPAAPAGVRVTMAAGEGRDGSTAARVTFDGRTNVNLSVLRQRLAVSPDAPGELELAYSVRADELTTDEGVFLEVVDHWSGRVLLQTDPVTGSLPWTRRGARFTLAAGAIELELRVRRRPSRRLDNKISGSFWLDDVALSLRESGA